MLPFFFFFSSEYLFLLTILIKPQSGFKIAFAMLDQDGNERIDKEEFRVLVSTAITKRAKSIRIPEDRSLLRVKGQKGRGNHDWFGQALTNYM